MASLISSPRLAPADVIARELGVSLPVVDRAIKSVGVPGMLARPQDGGRARRMFSPSEQKKIVQAIGIAPDGWISVTDLAAQLNIPETTLRSHAKRQGMTFDRYLNQSRNIREQFLAPEQQYVLRQPRTNGNKMVDTL